MSAEQQISTEPVPDSTATPGKPGHWKTGFGRYAQLDKGPGTFERPKYLLVLGRNLRRWREQRKMTRKRFAKAAGCSSRTIDFVESDEPRAIRHALIAQVATVIGVPAPILMLDADDLVVLCEQLLEVHGAEDLIHAMSQAIMQRRACMTTPPAL